jgi:hypothetical protein
LEETVAFGDVPYVVLEETVIFVETVAFAETVVAANCWHRTRCAWWATHPFTEELQSVFEKWGYCQATYCSGVRRRNRCSYFVNGVKY